LVIITNPPVSLPTTDLAEVVEKIEEHGTNGRWEPCGDDFGEVCEKVFSILVLNGVLYEGCFVPLPPACASCNSFVFD